jgi:hypothetical protein
LDSGRECRAVQKVFSGAWMWETCQTYDILPKIAKKKKNTREKRINLILIKNV